MNRINEIQNYLIENKLDAFLVLTKLNRQYLSGFTGSSGVLAITKNSAVLFVDDRYFLRAKKETKLPVKKLEQYSHILKNMRIRKVAVEDRLSLREFRSLKKQLKRISWKVTSNLVEDLRAQKSKDELLAIEKGSKIIDRVFEKVKGLVRQKKGITEAEIAYQIERYGKSLGAEGLAFDPIVAFGPNACSPHHFSSNAKIGRNNFLLLDFGFKVHGYHSDFTRTLFLGKPNARQVKVYETVLHSQLQAIEKVKLDVKASLVDKVARSYIIRTGFGKNFTHNSGHGVGLEIHEQPNFSPKSEDILKPNMVVTVEPGIYLPGKFGVRIEDMVVVGKKPRILSRIRKDFASMIIK